MKENTNSFLLLVILSRSLNLNYINFVLGYDCPVVKDIWQFVTYISGASLTAAKALTTMQYRYSINWCGGWHHALRFRNILFIVIKNIPTYNSFFFMQLNSCFYFFNRDSAQGFCYVNDIVLAIEMLRKTFRKVLYIDIDVHHGNNFCILIYFHKYFFHCFSIDFHINKDCVFRQWC